SDKQANVESPVGYIVGVVTVVVIIGVAVAVFILRGRFACLSPPLTTNGNMNATVKADIVVENKNNHKDAIHEAESTPGVYYNNSVALQRPKVSVDGLVEYVDSLTQDDIKVAF
ncbi:hypothetical protein MAR_031492, partial [Mya arenaria]